MLIEVEIKHVGTTWVEFHGRGFEARDAFLEIWLHLLVEELDQLPNRDAWFEDVRDTWELQSTAGFGFGVMPELDRLASNAERRHAITELAHAALRRLDNFKPAISRDFLNRWQLGGPRTVFMGDIPVGKIEQVARQFIDLLENRE